MCLNTGGYIVPGIVVCVPAGCFGNELVYFCNMPEDMYLVYREGPWKPHIGFHPDVYLCD